MPTMSVMLDCNTLFCLLFAFLVPALLRGRGSRIFAFLSCIARSTVSAATVHSIWLVCRTLGYLYGLPDGAVLQASRLQNSTSTVRGVAQALVFSSARAASKLGGFDAWHLAALRRLLGS